MKAAERVRVNTNVGIDDHSSSNTDRKIALAPSRGNCSIAAPLAMWRARNGGVTKIVQNYHKLLWLYTIKILLATTQLTLFY